MQIVARRGLESLIAINKSWEETLWEAWLHVCPSPDFLQHLGLVVVRNGMRAERAFGFIHYGCSCVAILDSSKETYLKYLSLHMLTSWSALE